MEEKKVKETLEKQMNILSECAQNSACTACELAEISQAMAEIARILMYPAWCQEVARASRRC